MYGVVGGSALPDAAQSSINAGTLIGGILVRAQSFNLKMRPNRLKDKSKGFNRLKEDLAKQHKLLAAKERDMVGLKKGHAKVNGKLSALKKTLTEKDYNLKSLEPWSPSWTRNLRF